MANEERASHVCNNCKVRKRACDKQTPRCGHCTRRGLTCSYDIDLVVPNKRLAVGSLADLLACTSEATFAGMLNLQVCQIIHRTGVSIRATSDSYFRAFYQWLPVVSSESVGELVRLSEHAVPTAAGSILLMAMYLITDGLSGSTASTLDLYLALKVYYQHAVSLHLNCLQLVQAGILIGIFEYATPRVEIAYVTIGIAARLAFVINLPAAAETATRPSEHPSSGMLEARNSWWSIVLLERLIYAELANRTNRFYTAFPANDAPLPSSQTVDRVHTVEAFKAPSQFLGDGSSFGRQVLAVGLLDRVIHTVGIESENISTAELEILDQDLQHCLRIELERGHTEPHSEAAAIIVRALFLLHDGILSHPEVLNKPEDYALRQTSRAARDSLVRMIFTAVSHHAGHHHIGRGSPLPVYNLRLAIEHARQHPRIVTGEVADGLRTSIDLDMAFRQRWQ